MTRHRSAVLLGILWLGAAGSSASGAADGATAGPTGGATAATPAQPTRYSATSLYNLGNSYARAGKPGLAVLNYERASLLAPDDPDIEANLRFVRDAARVPSVPPTRFESIFTPRSPNLPYWTGLLGILLAGSCLLSRAAAGSRYTWPRRFGIATGLALVGTAVCNAWVLWPRLHDAVVLTAAAPARVSPVPMGDPVFTLPEAETVRMTAEHEGFVLVQTRTGRTGWMAGADLAPVVPKQ